jgi:hypothetical protein
VPIWDVPFLAEFPAFPDGELFLNPQSMRRALVLTDESRSHPFLASLPPHVRALDDESLDQPIPEKYWRLHLTRKDWRDIIATYCGAFAAVTVFFA